MLPAALEEQFTTPACATTLAWPGRWITETAIREAMAAAVADEWRTASRAGSRGLEGHAGSVGGAGRIGRMLS
jgi:hypothetical protein